MEPRSEPNRFFGDDVSTSPNFCRTEEKDDGFSAIGGGLVEEELGEGLCRFENAIEAAATRPAKPLTSFSDDA